MSGAETLADVNRKEDLFCEMAVEIIHQRLIQHRRRELAAVAEAREAYRRGEVHRGTVADLMEELSE